MKSLLRSCFICKESDDDELFKRNILSLKNNLLGFQQKEDVLIWDFVGGFFDDHSHAPNLKTIRDYFESIRETEVVTRLERLSRLPPKTRGDFERHLENKVEERRVELVKEYITETAKIAVEGLTLQEGKRKKPVTLKGAVDAVRYFQEKSHNIIAPKAGQRLSGDLVGDTAFFKERYELVENDPTNGMGQFSGIHQLDTSMRGVQAHQLWTHAAFTGHGKSSLALQWAYNQAIIYRYSVYYCSLEMPFHQCMNIIHVMHTFHEKFREIRIKLGIQKPSKKLSDGTLVHFDKGLEYEKLKNGELSEVERRFLFEYVEKDLADIENQYGKIHLEVPNPDKSKFTVADLKSAAELRYAKDPFHMMVVDHMGLMQSMDYKQNTTEVLNEVLRGMKQLSMNFNRGAGIGILGLYQISRDGFRNAEKNDGRYTLVALSYASEAEKSSDVVTAGWMDDELKAKGRLYIQCLKSRDATPFERFGVRIEWHCRRMLTDFDGIEMDGQDATSEQQNEEVGAALDAMF